MHLRSTLTTSLAAAVLATAVYAGSAMGATARFNACALLSARQLSAIHVKGGHCSQKTAPFQSYATATIATWGRLGVQSSYTILTVYAVKPAYVTAGRQLLDKDGTSVGVGDWSAFKGLFNGKTGGDIVFGVGDYIVDLRFGTTASHPLTSAKPFIALAKAVAGKLK